MAKETKEVVTEVNEVTGEVKTEAIEIELETEVEELEDVKESEFVFTGLYVQRIPYKKDGKDRYYYRTSRKTRRITMTCDFKPVDLGGYEQLDAVFFDKDIKVALPLWVVTKSFKDNNSGKTVTVEKFYVRDYDEEEKIWYTAELKPSEASDKGNLVTLRDLASRD